MLNINTNVKDEVKNRKYEYKIVIKITFINPYERQQIVFMPPSNVEDYDDPLPLHPAVTQCFQKEEGERERAHT